MTETAADVEQQDDTPRPITATELEGCTSAILNNIENGLADPLLGLSEETEEQLLRLAYTDLVGLERLERLCKARIRDRGDGEPAAKAFNLGTYKRGATQLRRKLQEENARRAKMRERNLRLVQGGKKARDQGGTDVEMPDDAAISVQAMCEASSVFLRAVGLLMLFRKGRVWYDEFYGDYFTDWNGSSDDTVIPVTKVDDAFMLSVHQYLLMLDTKLGASGSTNTEKAIHRVGDEDRRNEPREWLKALKWDGEERLPELLSRAYGSPNDRYHAAVGRCWFVSMAARIMQPGCKVDTMPVFFGPQGTFKSTSLEVIGGRWYRTINTTADSKDFLDALRGVLVAEVAELDAIHSNRVENSRVKTLLSTRVDSYRPAYGRTTREFLRTAVLAGTTNDAGWHRDETGGRRFWPVHCQGQIDIAWLKEMREQLFAEALHRYGEGESWSDVPRDLQEAMVASHYNADPWEERIAQALATWRIYTGTGGSVRDPSYPGGFRPKSPSVVEARLGDPAAHEEEEYWGTLVTTNRIMTVALQLDPSRQTKREANRVASTMRRIGWRQQTVRVKCGEKTTTQRAWVVMDDQTPGDAEIEPKLL